MPTALPDRADRAFWSLPADAAGNFDWCPQWKRLLDLVRDSDPLTLFWATEEGVPSWTVKLLSTGLALPESDVVRAIGLSPATYGRAIGAGRRLPDAAAHRVVAMVRIVARVRQMDEESSDPAEAVAFDVPAWFGRWISQPLPAMGGMTPKALLRNPEGQRLVEALVERMRGGLVA